MTLNKYEDAVKKDRKYETKKERKILTPFLSDLPSRHIISLIFYAFQADSGFTERE